MTNLLNNDIFNYNSNKINDDNISLAGSLISAYDYMNGNINDLMNIIDGGASKKKSCPISTTHDISDNFNDSFSEFSIKPSDSISNLDFNVNSKNKLNDLNIKSYDSPVLTSSPDEHSFFNNMKKISSILQSNTPLKTPVDFDSTKAQPQPTQLLTSPPNDAVSHISVTKSIFEDNPDLLNINSKSNNSFNNNNDILNNDYNVVNLDINSSNLFSGGFDLFSGGFDFNQLKLPILIIIMVFLLFLFIGLDSICNFVNSHIFYLISFILVSGIIIFSLQS